MPDTTCLIDTLREIDLQNNRFTRFPIELHAAKSLRILNLRTCYLLTEKSSTCANKNTILTSLRPSMPYLSIVGNNPIELLPRTINKMRTLEFLDLSRNLLRALPVEFTEVGVSCGLLGLVSTPGNRERWLMFTSRILTLALYTIIYIP
jgi:hypothetical protein